MDRDKKIGGVRAVKRVTSGTAGIFTVLYFHNDRTLSRPQLRRHHRLNVPQNQYVRTNFKENQYVRIAIEETVILMSVFPSKSDTSILIEYSMHILTSMGIIVRVLFRPAQRHCYASKHSCIFLTPCHKSVLSLQCPRSY